MGGENRELRDELQAQKAEIDELRDQIERNRTSSADRPQSGKKPGKSEGRDGEIRFVKEGSSMYVHFKASGNWYKAKLEKA